VKTLLFDLDGTLIDRDGSLFGGSANKQGARPRVSPEPAVQALLAILSRRYRTALISNGSGSNQRRKLRDSGLWRYLHSVTISGDVGVAKPHPALFLRACGTAGCRPAEVLMMIGDDPVCDIGGAAALAIPTCWVARGRDWPVGLTPPDVVVESVLDVAAVLAC
jgi:putative hydrolase of the HAD superfamily